MRPARFSVNIVCVTFCLLRRTVALRDYARACLTALTILPAPNLMTISRWWRFVLMMTSNKECGTRTALGVASAFVFARKG